MKARPDPYEYLDNDVDAAVDRLSDAAADRADELASLGFHIVDGYDPDDREPMGGDPYWREDEQ